MSTFINAAYRGVFRRSSTFFLGCVVAAVVFERVFDEGIDKYFESRNQGVSSFYKC